MKTYNYIIVGGGVVGCSIARELSGRGSVLVIEKNAQLGQETSLHNSGVIHSGVHLNPSFLKAKLAKEGGPSVINFCKNNDVPYRSVGMHIVVGRKGLLSSAGELPSFLRLVKRAREQHITMRFKTGRQICQSEPSVHALFGVHIPDVHVIDQSIYMQKLEKRCRMMSVEFALSAEVTALETDGNDDVIVTTNRGQFRGHHIINAAGLYADKIAKMGGYDYRLYFYRGEYYEISPKAGIVGNGLVYPVPPPHAKGLGTHLTPALYGGRLLLGPNATKVNGPEDYECNPTGPESFLEPVHQFLPSVTIKDVSWCFSGIRPKLTDEAKESDFIIRADTLKIPMINLIGIESPGLTASPAIAKYVAKLLS